MSKKSPQKRFGKLPLAYHFYLNPYPELRFSKCPKCERNKTGQRKLPLMIYIASAGFVALNYTNRYCRYCDLLIGHKHEIEHHLTALYFEMKPEAIGNDYRILGTVEKSAWKKNMNDPKAENDLRAHTHDFKSYEELRMTMAGWFRKDQEPPMMTPPGSLEWVKQKR